MLGFCPVSDFRWPRSLPDLTAALAALTAAERGQLADALLTATGAAFLQCHPNFALALSPPVPLIGDEG
jgi:hypothetical protein